MSRCVLITGAGGQLGQALCDLLDANDVIALPRSELDISRADEVSRVVDAAKPTLVINAAAYNAVDAAEEDRDGAFAGNVNGPRNLAEATARHEVPLVHVSSDYVFDGSLGRAYHELDEENPRTVYGESKLAGENAVREANPWHYIVRTAWLYHPNGKNFANTIVGIADRPEVSVVDDQRGSPTYVPHLAEGILRLVDSDAFGTFHVVNGGEASWFDFATALYEALELSTPIKAVTSEEFPRPAERPRHSVLTTMQKPRIELPDWREGVRDFAAQKRGLV